MTDLRLPQRRAVFDWLRAALSRNRGPSAPAPTPTTTTADDAVAHDTATASATTTSSTTTRATTAAGADAATAATARHRNEAPAAPPPPPPGRPGDSATPTGPPTLQALSRRLRELAGRDVDPAAVQALLPFFTDTTFLQQVAQVHAAAGRKLGIAAPSSAPAAAAAATLDPETARRLSAAMVAEIGAMPPSFVRKYRDFALAIVRNPDAFKLFQDVATRLNTRS